MSRSLEAVGNVSPSEVIQIDPLACMPACLLSQVDPARSLTEADITAIMTEDGLFVPQGGTGLYPATVLDATTRKFGLATGPLFDARLALDKDIEFLAVQERAQAILDAIDGGVVALLAYPKRRPWGRTDFLHYSVATGYEEAADGPVVTILDPSEIDGGVRHTPWEQFIDEINPSRDTPVMGWTLRSATESSRPLAVVSRNRTPKAAATTAQRIGSGLLTSPLWQPKHDGLAVPPDSEHPVSVAMTSTDITRQYTELGSVTLSRKGALPLSYPRFGQPPQDQELSRQTWGKYGELPFATPEAAAAAGHLARTYGNEDTSIKEKNNAIWLPASQLNEYGWQHSGLGVSSRQAQAVLEGRGEQDYEALRTAENEIKTRIAEHTGAAAEDIYLTGTGMAAIYLLNQASIVTQPDAASVQFMFSYVDTWEQRKFGKQFNPSKNTVDVRSGDYNELAEAIDGGAIRGVFTEWPSNPLLQSPDFGRLDAILRGRAPIILDETIGTAYNLAYGKLPDSVVACNFSMTKNFSGSGDAMSGAIILRPQSPFYPQYKAALEEVFIPTTWHEDLRKIAKNSRNFATDMPIINTNAERLARVLDQEWRGMFAPLDQIYHPSLVKTTEYDAVKKDGRGYGGLMSLQFNDPGRAYRFFDKLKVTKAPSLGTIWTQACLYTLLAHRDPDAVAKFGVRPDLIRVSIGIENFDDLYGRFVTALRAS